MTQKTTIAVAAATLLVGVGAVAFIYNNSAEKPVPAKSASSGKSGGSPGSASIDPAGNPATRSKSHRDPAENPDLVAKYGESRTVLSKHVATNVISLLDDAIELGEMATNEDLGKAFGGNRGGLQRALGKLGKELQLTPEQQEKAAPLYAAFQKRELEKAKASVESLKKDPSALMETMLASDAYSRGQMTEAEYKQTQASASADLKGVMNPLDRKNFGGGKPTQDPTFNQDFQGLLDPAQAETYQTSVSAEQTEAQGQPDAGNISNLPVMELEKLDDNVVAAKKMTGGIKQMMEGMGGLKDLAPMLDQQNKRATDGQN